MNLVNQSAFLKALGWSLLDSLWQMGVLWLIYVLLTANGKKFTARQRHSLALLSLAGGTLWFLVTLVINFYKAAAAPEIVILSAPAGELLSAAPSLGSKLSDWAGTAMPFLSMAYLLITALLLVRFYRQYRYTRRLFHQGLQKAHPELRVFLQQVVQHMSIPRKVNIWLSSMVDTPLTIGFWKPVILLPIAAMSHLTMEQAEAIILHELNHIRRNDYLVNLLIACTDIILFFNPFAQLLSGIIRREREHSCDDLVLQFRYDASQYARALLTLEQSRLAVAPALAVAATGKNNTLLLNRIKRMLTNEPVTTGLSQKAMAWLLSAVLIGFIGWYNPGRAIVTKIEEVAVKAPQSPYTELVADISTPAPTPGTVVVVQPKAAVAPVAPADMPETAAAPDELSPLEILDAEDIASIQQEIAQLARYQDETAKEMVAYASVPELRDYSMQATREAFATVTTAFHPYVPGNSFLVQVLEDTLLPKKYTMTISEKEAQETCEKALYALKAIDWQKVEKELKAAAAGQNLNIQQLQQELKKALKEIDWKKINQETEKAMTDARRELVEEQALLRVQMEHYNQARQQKQEKLNQVQYQILMDRLGENEKKTSCESAKPTAEQKCVKKKKVVVI